MDLQRRLVFINSDDVTLPLGSFCAAGASFFSAASWVAPAGIAAITNPANTKESKVKRTFICILHVG